MEAHVEWKSLGDVLVEHDGCGFGGEAEAEDVPKSAAHKKGSSFILGK